MRGADSGCGVDGPGDVVAEPVEVSEDDVETEVQVVGDVLEGDQWRLESPDGVGDERPDVSVVAGPVPLSCDAEWLARITGGEDVDGFDLPPVDGGDVAEVGDGRVVVGEDRGGAGVAVGHPCQLAAEDVLYGTVEAAVAGAQ